MSHVENLVLDHLRALRAGQDRMEHKLTEVNARFNSLETAIVRPRSDTLSTQDDVDVDRQQAAIDRLNERMERIERRLELQD